MLTLLFLAVRDQITHAQPRVQLVIRTLLGFHMLELVDMCELSTRDHLIEEECHHALLETQLDHCLLELPLYLSTLIQLAYLVNGVSLVVGV
jgi:hypothetical protein